MLFATFLTPAGLRIVRILKTILTLLVVAAALIGGLFTAAVVVVGSIVVLVTRRFLRGPARPTVAPPPRASHPRSTPAAGDVIEVTATEVPVREHRANSGTP